MRHAGGVIEGYHGDESTLGPYRVFVLTAQAVHYREGCADAGLVGVSYAIVRADPEP